MQRAKYEFKCFTWPQAVRHAARKSSVLMDAAEVSLWIIVLMVTQVQISPWPFTDLHPSVYSHTGKLVIQFTGSNEVNHMQTSELVTFTCTQKCVT